MNDEAWMRVALAQAKKGRAQTAPNPMVGCVIVANNKRVAQGFHQRAGLPHAERMALARAGRLARGATLYVTLEPCCHTGRTGPCDQAILAAGIKRVVVGVIDPNPKVRGQGVARLRRQGVKVDIGVLPRACAQLIAPFAHAIVHRRSFVVAKVAQSLDGCSRDAWGQSRWITGETARAWGHVLRHNLEAIIVGRKTIVADDPALTCRLAGGRDPLRVILDPQAKTPPKAQVLRLARQGRAKTLICCLPNAHRGRLSQLADAGAEIVLVPPRRHGPRAQTFDLSLLLNGLYQRGVIGCLVEGGPTTLSTFFDARCVNHVVAFVSPRILGGHTAGRSVGGRGTPLAEAKHLQDLRYQRLGEDLVIAGRVAPPNSAPSLPFASLTFVDGR